MNNSLFIFQLQILINFQKEQTEFYYEASNKCILLLFDKQYITPKTITAKLFKINFTDIAKTTICLYNPKLFIYLKITKSLI